MLRGITPPEGIPRILDVPSLPMFDWRQLKRWNLNVSALSEGSIVINREFTLWDYKYYIIGILVLCLAETALIIFLIVQKRQRRRAEGAVRKSEAKYRQLHESMMDGYVLVDMDGIIKEYNETYQKMTGYMPEEMLRLTYRDPLRRNGTTSSRRLSRSKS
jgi:PAS domain-containing protein